MNENRTISVARMQLYAAACLAWVILAAWVAFDTGLREGLIFGVCTVFAVVVLGVTAVLGNIAAHRRSKGMPEALDQPAEQIVQTRTGALSPRQAAIQILLAPAALAVGFTAIAIVDVVVRHSA